MANTDEILAAFEKSSGYVVLSYCWHDDNGKALKAMIARPGAELTDKQAKMLADHPELADMLNVEPLEITIVRKGTGRYWWFSAHAHGDVFDL